MPVTTISNMQIVPEKFTQYTLDRTTEKSMLVRSGIATPDATLAQLINGTPEGGRFITMPAYNPLEGEDEVFGEQDVSVGEITTKQSHATLLMRQRAWGATDLAHVLSGSDPMRATADLLSDWWVIREQKIYMSILKGILDKTNGALKEHINDISGGTGEAAVISVAATLDTKQLLGDAYGSLGMVFMHSATYTALQKQQQIVTEYNSDLKVKIDTYLGYRVVVDDGMPVNGNVYDTFFLGSGAFARQDGNPAGFVGTETDRDKIGAKDYLINRRCMVIHPRGLSWNINADLGTGSDGKPLYYPTNAHLETPANWTLATDHKKVPIACLKHKIG